jgi:hypothetical protein
MDGKASLVGWGTSMAMGVLLLLSLPVQAKYGGGSGTADDPYLIAAAEQMNAIGLNPEDWGKHFRLVTDIDLKELTGSVFHPIALFNGVFDGDGHTIANLTLVITGSEDTSGSDVIVGMGLFGSVQCPDAVIENLGLVNPEVRPTFTCPKRLWCVGALAGQVWSGSIRNCYVTGGQVQGERWVGGLVGSNSGTVSDCHASCVVQPGPQRPLPAVPGQLGHRELFGGLVGETYGAISNCWSSGNVSGDNDVGGLVGQCRRPVKISHCYAKVDVTGQTCVGGLVGVCSKGCSIADCFAAGNVYGVQQTGGLVGCHESEVLRCYSTGSVSATSDFVGGLVGLNGGVISASWAGGKVFGGHGVGGLAGWNMKEDRFLLYDPVVKDSYARGNVQGKNVVGGLIGSNQEGAVIRCYSTGQVRGETKDSLVSGLVCTDDPALVKGSFWDVETSSLSMSDGGTGKTTAEMQNMLTYLAAGWDFVGEPYNGTEDVWEMSSGRPMYPRLAWEQMLGGDIILTGVPE